MRISTVCCLAVCCLALILAILAGCARKPPAGTSADPPDATTTASSRENAGDAERARVAEDEDRSPDERNDAAADAEPPVDASVAAAEGTAPPSAAATGPEDATSRNEEDTNGKLAATKADSPEADSPENRTEGASRRSPNDAADQPPAASRRLLLFGTEGPLLVELRMTLDGAAFDEPLRKLMDEVLRVADANQDGVTTWEELTESPDIRYGQFGNQPINTVAERRTIKQNYDGGDDRVDRYELLAFLNSNQQGGGVFSLTSSNQFREDNQTRSHIKQLLDWDEDERLSAEEMDAAAVRLRSRDNDEDDILFLDDFKAASNTAPQLGMANARTRLKRYGPRAAVVLDRNTEWNSLLVSLQDLYTFGGDVGPEPFSLAPGIFERLDGNRDGVLQPIELSGLLTVEPQLVFAARFGVSADGSQVEQPLELLAVSPELQRHEPVISRSRGRCAITLPSMDVLFYVSDMAPVASFDQQAQAQLMQLDRDANGYVDREELSAVVGDQGASFESLDRDGDGKLFLAELRESIRRRQAAGRSQLRAYAADQEDALFSALDTNNDGRLTTREIDQASENLRRLDSNQDGQLTAYEIPGSMLVAITRSNQAMMNGPPAPPAVYAALPDDLPAWFQQMDQNRDGDLSRLEFLGDDDQFERLDASGDGFIEPAEATDAG